MPLPLPPSIVDGRDSSKLLAAFLFSASNLACNFLSTGSFNGPTLDRWTTLAPSPSLTKHEYHPTQSNNKLNCGNLKKCYTNLEGRPSGSTFVVSSSVPLVMLLTHSSALHISDIKHQKQEKRKPLYPLSFTREGKEAKFTNFSALSNLTI